MERATTLDEAKTIMGTNFIGPKELALMADKLDISIPTSSLTIPFSLEELTNKRKDYLLILGTSKMSTGVPLTLKSLRDHFGYDPMDSEPCFYNQDWYLKEDFFNQSLNTEWYLLRKSVIVKTRAKNPDSITLNISLPSAILCAYTFFAYWHHFSKKLWNNDYIWCRDFDNNGDRIYVGRYMDPEGVNKNGFSIHRHLSLRNNYGCINTY